MRGFAGLAAIAAALLATACIPQTKTLLSDPGAQPIDERLIGTWYWHIPKNNETVVIDVQRADGKLLNILWTNIDPARVTEKTRAPVTWTHMRGHTTRLGQARFINLLFVRNSAARDGKTRLIVRYWLTDRGLAFATMKDEMVGKAIETGELTGYKEKRNWIITSDRKTLRAYLRRHGAKAFEDPGQPLRRMH